jgi:putative IMPACT (imprinted ancient) family translation regulator
MQRELDEFTAKQSNDLGTYKRERQRYIDSLKNAQTIAKIESAKIELTVDYKAMGEAQAHLQQQKDSTTAFERELLAVAIAKLNRESEQRLAKLEANLSVAKVQVESKFRFKWQGLSQSTLQSCVGACPSLFKIMQQSE